MRILCRKSMIKYMKPDLEEIFTITKQGMQYYSGFFDYVYPFDKYDQIWVPVRNEMTFLIF
jgi:aminopeptidase N